MTNIESTDKDANTEKDLVSYSAISGVATISLDAVDQKNSLAPETVNDLVAHIDMAIGDSSVRVIVITNTGNTFCAGANLKASQPGVSQSALKYNFVDVLQLIMNAPKPVIAKADGHATGGGVGLLAACDISVMRNDAKIGFTEARLGVAPAVISVVCLPKMRRADASELFLTAERFSPDRAKDVGLINAAVDPEDLDQTTQNYIDKIGLGSPAALAACKRLVAEVPSMPIDEAFAWTSEFSAALFQSNEAQAGIAAFINREPAPWAAKLGDDQSS